MTESVKVLVVDDDKVWRAYLTETLKDAYEVTTAADGDEGLAAAFENPPDAVLLDLEMPNKGGFEVCQALKQNPQTSAIPVIFLSTKSSLREKIASFQLGADDYLVKPGEAEILRAKVDRATALYREKRELDRAAADAKGLAFGALNSSADLGRSLRFAERTYTMNSYDKLAEGLFQTMGEFGLDTAVMFITHQGPRFYAQNKHELTPLEQDMFKAIHQEGRFVDFGCRTFCNFKLVSILMKNMPLEDQDRYGQIKDMIPWILGAAEGKVGSLDVHSNLTIECERMAEAIQNLEQKLNQASQSVESGESYAEVATYLHSAQSDLVNLSELQKAMINLILAETQGEAGNELAANEIFSSDVDFF